MLALWHGEALLADGVGGADQLAVRPRHPAHPRHGGQHQGSRLDSGADGNVNSYIFNYLPVAATCPWCLHVSPARGHWWGNDSRRDSHLKTLLWCWEVVLLRMFRSCVLLIDWWRMLDLDTCAWSRAPAQLVRWRAAALHTAHAGSNMQWPRTSYEHTRFSHLLQV